MSSEVAIRIRNLGKAYPLAKRSHPLRQMFQKIDLEGAFWALRGVNLDVHRGEVIGVLGRNGSGKSTLLEMITGTLRQSEGEVEVRGRIAALLSLGAGFNPDFTGAENVRLSATVLGLNPSEIEARFDEMVTFSGIGDFIDRPVRTYSTGMYTRLAFALAINVDPDILIVDEVLSVGDEVFQRKCFARIDEIRERGATILFVSHSASLIVELCDRALLLDRGEPLITTDPKTAVTLYQQLIYAPEDQMESIRTAILAQSGTSGADAAVYKVGNENPESGKSQTVSDEEPVEPAFWDPHLKSQSTVLYERNGAWIENPVIQTRAAEPVNNLAAGARYVFCYSVLFDRDAFDVRYHMLVKTVTGLELGGGIYPPIGQQGVEVAAGERIQVRFEFNFHLNPDVYFLNCGVTGCGGSQLHRIIDAVAFRTLPLDQRETFGHIHFDMSATTARV